MNSKNYLKIQCLSDLHLEIWDKFPEEIPKCADTIILAGDIGNIRLSKVKQFFKDIANLFNDVVFVFGNHDYYQFPFKEIYTMSQYEDEMKEFVSYYPNIHLLQKSLWKHSSGINFCGCTLWDYTNPQIKDIKINFWTDYNQIYINSKNSGDVKELLNPDTENELYTQHCIFLEKVVKQQEHLVIVTHHVPIFKQNIFDFITDEITDFEKNGFLQQLMKENVKLWVCGHNHFSCFTKLQTVPLLLNPIGFPNQIVPYYLTKTYEIQI